MKTLNEDGMLEEYHYDESEDRLIHRVSHDVTALIDQNKREFNASDRSYKKPMEKIASIDPIAAQNCDL